MAKSKQDQKRPVVFIHDAAIDDFIATLLLVAMPNVDLKGIIVANADCIPEPAMDVCSLLNQFMGRPKMPLGLSSARGWNPFPWPYRGDVVNFAKIPSLRRYRSTVRTPPPSGDELLVKLLEAALKARERLTVLLTTAFTPLTDVTSKRPDLVAAIGDIIWMGGAIGVNGNLDPSTVNPAVANKHAEWNVFFDPFAVHTALQSFSDINVFPLDITNTAAIMKGFMNTLKKQGQQHTFSQLAYEGYSLVSNEPFYDMWDVCATCYLARPDLYAQAQRSPLSVVQWGFEQGWLKKARSGKPQNLFLRFADQAGFYSYVTSQLARSA
ncbi:MAG: nucleoside hydrolase [Xanthobacteraceae bacterium]